ncbi:unnamed protein product [Adineta steineri]|uniref:Poly [ADP-ribose] polymerase n=1 Tax=Adineta steineri TaxID=433720 RepID=A0A819AT68_9BILA|nr:unnamed protein product [Adineta steineri]CAF3792725.1 unnamed protein product [Adineta steineri]CAF4165720.1 unnamed protein product [Adineta steineri]
MYTRQMFHTFHFLSEMDYEQSTTSSNTSGYSDGLDSSFSNHTDDDNNDTSLNSGNSIQRGSPTIKLSSEFVKLYPACDPHLYYGPLNDDTVHALSHNNSRPLILLLHNDKSVAANIFRNNVLGSEVIVDYLMENFIVWTWDRTYELNHEYVEFENMLKFQMGKRIQEFLRLIAADTYPLLLCIMLQHGQLQIISKIYGQMSREEVYLELLRAHDKFDRRTQTFNILEDSSLLCKDFLAILLEDSAEYVETVNKLAILHRPILRIYIINVPHWVKNYTYQKKIIDARIGHRDTERLLFHGCTPSAAASIIQHRFDHELIGLHGTSHGHGFYFSSRPFASYPYARADTSSNERAILMCHVIVGKSCIGDSKMQKCPDGYDSTNDSSNNTYVIYSNEQILPQYLVIYE